MENEKNGKQKFTESDGKIFENTDIISFIGEGSIGGKSSGLVYLKSIIDEKINSSEYPNIEIDIPRFTVIRTSIFDAFMKRNDLYKIALSNADDGEIARAFQKAALPAEIVGDLRALIKNAHTPLAIRSSSMLEDSKFEPFAGIYATKMIANNSPSADDRFKVLTEAIKLVYASTFFKAARDYFDATPHSIENEKMAVIIQEVCGEKHYDRFYPEISGVARSYNYYPTGRSKPENGVVNLALGLGKTIVDGGICWTYPPNMPKSVPPFASASDMVKNTQIEFWAVNMGHVHTHNAIGESEYLSNLNLKEAEYDGTLRYIASTYNSAADRIVTGMSIDGARILNFAPLLIYDENKYNNLLKSILKVSEESLNSAVELEFAMTFQRETGKMKLHLLQLRPMFVSSEKIDISDKELFAKENLLSSDKVLGNGIREDIRDIIFVKKDTFNAADTPKIAQEIEIINRTLMTSNTPSLIIGFGRWGSSDPWLGIPVEWGQIGSAKAIVELTLPDMNVELSQGSHFFHNVTSFKVSYFSIKHDGDYTVDWEWLDDREVITELKFVKHLRLDSPLLIKVDGRKSLGLIKKTRASSRHTGKLIYNLQERAKELNCLYAIEDSLNNPNITTEEAFANVLKAIPPGWQFPEISHAKIVYDEKIYKSDLFMETPWFLRSDIIVQEQKVGFLSVYYGREMPEADDGPFFNEEKKLLDTIANRLGYYILHEESKNALNEQNDIPEPVEQERKGDWKVIMELMKKTEPGLYRTILRKLLYHLCWNEIEEAEELLKSTSIERKEENEERSFDDNKPAKKKILDSKEYIEKIMTLTQENLKDEETLAKIQKWIFENSTSYLVKSVENIDTSLAEIGDALRKYFTTSSESFELSEAVDKGLRVSLIRRFFNDQVDYISIAKEFVDLRAFYRLIDRIVFPPSSHGKLGGKSGGLFLAAYILRKCSEENELLKHIRVPKTWHISSDAIIYFLQYNNLEEVIEQKYKDIEEIRREYPHIVQIFKNSQFPPEILQGLSVALDDFGDSPIVVRSSSLLEDQIGAAFSGKYKSLFLANQGNKKDRLSALTDAIAEVYASTFSPDPIEYRAERGLLDFHEEMGVMIQQVVGSKIGNYYMPSYAGVAFSNNEFRWSPRIKREDGLLRLVAGLGTRAVDRLSDDYPLLVAPGQPNLSVNTSVDEAIRYSPQKIDVINLVTNEFESKDIREVLLECGYSYPAINNLISIVRGDHLMQPMGMNYDFEKDEYVISFEGLIKKTNFIKQISSILRTLQDKMRTPVDIEFASDGKDLYLLQCRPQSHSREITPDPIPRDIAPDKILFSASKYVSNGKVPEVTHIVYVDPSHYNEIEEKSDLLAVGRAVGRLNKLLPKRQFILMGPGRWGSRGDIKLGVNVTYSDINNSSMLIEIARKKGNYTPDLSFGTHFFQDLVEASIRYLPLYPDEEKNTFNESFFLDAKNILPEILPEYANLKDVIKVIDIPGSTGGMILRVLVNGDIDEALAIFASSQSSQYEGATSADILKLQPSDHWKWRLKMAEKIAASIDPYRFGVKGVYLFGSTKNSIAGPNSDIDLIVHVDDEPDKLIELQLWLEGWSMCLSEMNFLRTGMKSDGLLDVEYVTDADIAKKTSYAVKINAVTDAAKQLTVGKKSPQ